MYKKPKIKMSYNIGNMENGNVSLTDAWKHTTTNPWAKHWSESWGDVWTAGWIAGWTAYA